MNKKDNYVVYIKPDGTELYFKGKILHRENGPAIVWAYERDKYEGIVDNPPYKQVICPYDEIFHLVLVKKTLPKEVLNHYSSSHYFVNGVNFSQSAFLAQKLQRDLPAKKESRKVMKV